jgi:hypothetical protein
LLQARLVIPSDFDEDSDESKSPRQRKRAKAREKALKLSSSDEFVEEVEKTAAGKGKGKGKGKSKSSTSEPTVNAPTINALTDEDMEVVKVEMIFDRVNMGGATTQHDEGTPTMRAQSKTASSSPCTEDEQLERERQNFTLEDAAEIDRILYPPAADPPAAGALPKLDATLTHDATIMADDSAMVAVRPPSKVYNVL